MAVNARRDHGPHGTIQTGARVFSGQTQPISRRDEFACAGLTSTHSDSSRRTRVLYTTAAGIQANRRTSTSRITAF
jgi:hypothetical protein